MLWLVGLVRHAQQSDDPAVAHNPEIWSGGVLLDRRGAELFRLFVVRQRLCGCQPVTKRRPSEARLNGAQGLLGHLLDLAGIRDKEIACEKISKLSEVSLVVKPHADFRFRPPLLKVDAPLAVDQQRHRVRCGIRTVCRAGPTARQTHRHGGQTRLAQNALPGVR